MKVAVTAKGPSLDDQVDQRFGRARYLIVTDTESGEFEVHDNEVNLNATQGAGIQTAQNVSRLGVGAVITGHVGPNAFRTLHAAGVAIYTGAAGSVKEAAAELKNGTLSRVQDARCGGPLDLRNKLVIAVASGKGGTGKTTVATNLASVIANSGGDATYLDCDVEEPNGHIFLKPQIKKATTVTVPVPVVDETKCTACGKCRDICQYSAIILLKDTVLTFPNLCHGCGGCQLVCPTGAISESGREVGVVEEGWSGRVRFVHGKLNIGEAMSPPLIRKVKELISASGVSIVDAPPGTSCPVIESVKGADFVILVAEPTPFGLNDLKLAVEMLRVLKLPFGVLVNRADMGDNAVFDYCRDESIEVLLEIPDDRRVAEAYSRGILATDALPEYRVKFTELISRIQQMTAGGAARAARIP